MTVPSIDTYLRVNIKKYLDDLLSNSNLLKTKILNEFDPDVVDSFTNTFCTDTSNDSVDIPVSFTFNNDKPVPYATILIQEKAGEENNDSLGQRVGEGKNDRLDIKTESVPMQYDENEGLAYYEVSLPVKKVTSIRNSTNNFIIKGNRIYINSEIIGKIAQSEPSNESIQVVYSPKRDMKGRQVRTTSLIGFDATEEFVIDIISQSIDTLRCLSGILKMVLLTMRFKSQEENYEYRLGKMTWESVDLLQQQNSPFNSTNGNQTYTKRINVQMSDTYDLDMALGYTIKDIKEFIEEKDTKHDN